MGNHGPNNHFKPQCPTSTHSAPIRSIKFDCFRRFLLACFGGACSEQYSTSPFARRLNSKKALHRTGRRGQEMAEVSLDKGLNNRFLTGNLLKIGRNPLVFGLFYAILAVPMAIQKKNAFSRRLPDLVTEELVTVLSQKKSFEFKQLFAIVHENLRQRNAASGGEEMLRLRAYEKLQNLVARGVVKKNGKIYKGDSGALAAMAAANAAQAAAIASKP